MDNRIPILQQVRSGSKKTKRKQNGDINRKRWFGTRNET